MDEAGIASLKAAFEAASTWSECCTIAVALGVFIEFVAIFVFSKEMPKSEKWVMGIATLVIVFGCGGEYVFGHRASIAATQLQDESDRQIRTLAASAKDADGKIADAQKDAAQARLDTAKLTASNLDLQKKNADLEKAISPRIIDQRLMIQTLRAYSGTTVRTLAVLDFESRRLGTTMRFALASAGWAALPVQSTSADFMDGVQIAYKRRPLGLVPLTSQAEDAFRRGQASAEALAEELTRDNNIAATANGFAGDFLCRAGNRDVCAALPAPGELLVLIGPKPLDPAIEQQKIDEMRTRDPHGMIMFNNR